MSGNQPLKMSEKAAAAPKCDFSLQLQADLPRPAPHAKIFRFSPAPNHPYNSRHPVPRRGALAIVTNVGAGCGGRGSVRRERLFAGRHLAVSEHGAQDVRR